LGSFLSSNKGSLKPGQSPHLQVPPYIFRVSSKSARGEFVPPFTSGGSDLSQDQYIKQYACMLHCYHPYLG